MSNIFAFHYKLQEKLKELIQLIASIYKYKVNNIILTQQYLMYAPLKKRYSSSIFMFLV